MWEVTDTDRHRWQMAAITRLSTMVRLAAERGYPALTWTVGPTGGLVGTVTGPDADRRVAFEVWASEIGANRRTETPAPGGIIRLYAAVVNLDGTATVAIAATLFPPDDETGGDV